MRHVDSQARVSNGKQDNPTMKILARRRIILKVPIATLDDSVPTRDELLPNQQPGGIHSALQI